MIEVPYPTTAELVKARELYVRHEPRFGVWDLARQAVLDSDGAPGHMSRAEAIAALLRDWNSEYYRTRPGEIDKLVTVLDGLLDRFGGALDGYAERSIVNLDDNERDAVSELFEGFRGELGAVGASKALGLLAPDFLPMWDTRIRKRYGVHTVLPGQHVDAYWQFMLIARGQICALDIETLPPHPLKRLDEYNYYRFTLRGTALEPGGQGAPAS